MHLRCVHRRCKEAVGVRCPEVSKALGHHFIRAHVTPEVLKAKLHTVSHAPSLQRSGHPRFVLVQRLASITPGSLRNEMVWRRCITVGASSETNASSPHHFIPQVHVKRCGGARISYHLGHRGSQYRLTISFFFLSLSLCTYIALILSINVAVGEDGKKVAVRANHGSGWDKLCASSSITGERSLQKTKRLPPFPLSEAYGVNDVVIVHRFRFSFRKISKL